jgi:mono/diheme cytochrome c family protein
MPGPAAGEVAIVSGVIRSVAVLLVVVVAALAAGCGGSGVAAPGQADLANGKKVFQASCGGCHTLADAGTHGTIGPNLDDAAVGDRMSNLNPSSFEALVRNQISEPDPDGKMPANIVTGADAEDVAAYVASVAGVALAKQERQQYGVTTTPQ